MTLDDSIKAPIIAWHQANPGQECSGQERRNLEGLVKAACAAVNKPRTDKQVCSLVADALRKVRGIIKPEFTKKAFAPKPIGAPTSQGKVRVPRAASPPALSSTLLSFLKDSSSDRRPLSASCVRCRLRWTSATPSTTPSTTPSATPSTTPSPRQKLKAERDVQSRALIAADPIRVRVLYTPAEMDAIALRIFDSTQYAELGGLTMKAALGASLRFFFFFSLKIPSVQETTTSCAATTRLISRARARAILRMLFVR